MSVVGFDFGTESCIISVCRRGGLDVLQNETGNRKTRSMVAYSGNQRFIGDTAQSQESSNIKNTLTNFKNLLRVNRVDHPDLKEEQQYMPFKCVDAGDGQLGIEVKYDYKKLVLSPQQVTAALLQKLKTTAEYGLNARVVDCVISVPPMWTEDARWGLLDAAKVAGLNVLRLMNETAAVALTYGFLRTLPPNPINVLFLDMGASHTNVAVVNFQQGKLQVLAVDTNNSLGGRAFDSIIFDHFASQIKTKYKLDVTTNQKACLKLLKCCKKTKMTLSANNLVPWGIEYLMNDTDVRGQITRAEFETAAEPLLEKLAPMMDAVLAKAGIAKADLHSLEVVGGGIRVPCVQKAIKTWWGQNLSKTCDGDESVARGCAIQCAMLSPLIKVKPFNVVDANPFAIQVEWGAADNQFGLESLEAPLFAVKDPLPCIKLVSFTDRKEPFQIIASYANPESLPQGTNSHIGRFVVGGFPEASALTDQHPKVKVEFNLNLHGCFTVVKAVLMQVKPEEAEAAMDTTEENKAPENNKDNMDTSTDEKAAAPPAAQEPAKKKKKYNRTPLTFQAFTSALDEKTRNLYYEVECQQACQDTLVAETSAARDMLERYVLEMRSRCEDRSDLANYISDAEKTPFFKKLSDEDEWLESDEGYESTKSVYKKKLADLHKMGNPVVTRAFEHKERTKSVDMVKSMISHYQQFVESTEEKYAHITAEQKAPVVAKCAEVDQWIAVELTKQDRLPLNVNPTLTKAMLIAKAKELDGVCKPVKNIKKPAPPKVEKKAEEKKTEEPAAAPAEEKAAEPAPEPAPEPMNTESS